MTATEYGVVVAVGPEGVHDGALDLAAAEAVRRGTGVELLHVVHSLVAMPESLEPLESMDNALTTVGRKTLADAAGRIRPLLADRVPLSTELASGPVATTVMDRGAAAELVVMERRDTGAVERLLTMSISTRVAAHAHVPVAIVPEHWRPRTEDPGHVTVGVDRPLEALPQVEPALEYARMAGLPLVVLHASWLAEPYQDLGFSNDTRDKWVHEAERELDLVLSKIVEPTDEVHYDVQWRRPAECLVGASRVSSMVVLCRRKETQRGAHLGGITRTVLRHAHGPVLVVDRT